MWYVILPWSNVFRFSIVISPYEYFLSKASAQNTVEGVAPTQATTNHSAPSEPPWTTSRNPVGECATQGVPIPAHKVDNQDLHIHSGSHGVPGHGHEPIIPPPPNPGAKNIINPPDKAQAVPSVDRNVNTKTTMSSSTPNDVQIVHRLFQAEFLFWLQCGRGRLQTLTCQVCASSFSLFFSSPTKTSQFQAGPYTYSSTL